MALDTETFSILKDSIHRFVRERLVPNQDRVEEEDEVPAEIVAEMKGPGRFGLSIPVCGCCGCMKVRRRFSR